MATKTLTIPNDKVAEILEAFAFNYPIPRIPDPANLRKTLPKYTKAEWINVKLKEFVVKNVARHKTEVARRNATVPEDDTIVTIT